MNRGTQLRLARGGLDHTVEELERQRHAARVWYLTRCTWIALVIGLAVYLTGCATWVTSHVTSDPVAPRQWRACQLPELVVSASDDPTGKLARQVEAAVALWRTALGAEPALYAGPAWTPGSEPTMGFISIDFASQEVMAERAWESRTLGVASPAWSYRGCLMGGRVWLRPDVPSRIMVPVLVHEIGHLLGAEHSDEYGTYMSKILDPKYPPTEFGTDTIADLKAKMAIK